MRVQAFHGCFMVLSSLLMVGCGGEPIADGAMARDAAALESASGATPESRTDSAAPAQDLSLAADSPVGDALGPIESLIVALDTLQDYEFGLAGAPDTMLGGRLMRSSYWYRHKTTPWPNGYGTGFLFWRGKADSPEAVWLYRQAGDFGPHTWKWIDFDMDAKEDLLMFGGEENIIWTQIFLNRMADTFSVSNFSKVYHSEDQYVLVVDPEGDGVPEVLDPGPDLEDPIGLAISGCSPPDSLDVEIEREYERITGRFAGAHFGYGTQRGVPENLFLLHKVRLLRFHGGEFRDVTREYSAHLRWRLRMLEAIHSRDEVCTDVLEQIRTYLQGQLAGSEPEISAGLARRQPQGPGGTDA
ncbi:MAG TPA: hypothetical protein VF158_07730 [Longimicrobiales bacterium]